MSAAWLRARRFGCGCRTLWCRLDQLTLCKIRAVCDRHDRWMTR